MTKQNYEKVFIIIEILKVVSCQKRLGARRGVGGYDAGEREGMLNNGICECRKSK